MSSRSSPAPGAAVAQPGHGQCCLWLDTLLPGLSPNSRAAPQARELQGLGGRVWIGGLVGYDPSGWVHQGEEREGMAMVAGLE